MRLLVKIVIIIAVLFAGIYYGEKYLVTPKTTIDKIATPTVEEQTVKVSLILNYGNDQVKTFTDVNLGTDTTALALLKKVTTENNIELKYKDYGGDLGVFVEAIGNVAGDTKANKFWQYWVNGQLAQVGASKYELKDGDMVEWKYGPAEF